MVHGMERTRWRAHRRGMRLGVVRRPAKDNGKIRVRIEYGRSSGAVRFDSLSLVANP